MAATGAPSSAASRVLLVAGILLAASLGVVLLLPSGTFGALSTHSASPPPAQAPVVDPTQSACSGFSPAVQPALAQGSASDPPPAVVATVPVGSDPAFPVYDSANGFVYVTNSGSGNVSVLSGTLLVAWVPVGGNPVGAAYDGSDGFVYVANELTCTVSVISGTAVVATLSVGAVPSWVTYDTESQLVYVTNSGSGSVSVIQGISVLANVTVGASPDAVAANPVTGVAYVTNGVSNNVSLLNGTAIVGTIPVGSDPDFVAYDAANGEEYVTNDGSQNVSVIHGTSLVATVPVGNAPDSATFDASNGFVYVANYLSDNLTVLNGTLVVGNPTVGTGPTYGSYDSAAADVLVANYRSNTTSVLSGAAVVATVPVGLGPYILSFDAGNGFTYVTDSKSASVSVLGPTYSVTFNESGLPASSTWSVTLGDSSLASTTTSVAFSELPGVYAYTVAPPAGFRLVSATLPSPLTVVASAVTVDLSFAPVSNEAYSVTFTSTGLQSQCGGHPTWGVTLANSTQSTSGSSIVFEEKNGTYNYSILPPPGYTVLSATPSSPVTLNGANITVSVTFGKVQILSITFKEEGLAPGTTWCVTLGSILCTSGRSIEFANVTPGTYSYTVSPVTGYTINHAAGSVTVTTRSVTVFVQFESNRHGGDGGCMGPAGSVVGLRSSTLDVA